MNAVEVLRRNVAIRRMQRNLSQNDLAERSRVARQTVSKIESGRGNVTVEVLEKLAVALGCAVGELFEPRLAQIDPAEFERRAKAAANAVDSRALTRAINEAYGVRGLGGPGKPVKTPTKRR